MAIRNSEKIQILYIEDNPGDANLVKIYLKTAGVKHDLHLSDTFYEGIEIAEENPIDLVFLDLSLPDSHGFKTLTNFLAKFPKIPVIVMTGLNDDVVGNQSIKAGAQDFLVKGQFDSNLLGRVIRYSMQRHKSQLKLEQYAKSLSVSERRYVEAQEMAHFGNWEMDIVTNEMQWTDEVFRIFGFEPQSITPTLTDYLNFIHPDDRTKVEEAFSNVIKDGKLLRIDYRVIVDGRKIKHISNQIKVFVDETIEKIILVGAVQDITDIKLSQDLMVEKNLSERSSKIKEEILEDLGFHIRTPLSSLVNLSFLMENAETPEQTLEYVDGLKVSINDLSVAVNNLMNFSILLSEKVKLEENQFKVEELTQRIEQVFKIKADNKGVKLHVKLFDSVPETLIGDINKINQVIYNLTDNAIKFTNKGGTVSVKLACNDTKGENNRLFIFVEDTGEGIPSKKVEELKEAGELLTLNYDQEKRTGLGLAIVNKLTEKMKGSVNIESSIGKGTKVTIELPIKVAYIRKMQGENKPTAPLKILLVEDHFLNQIATKKVLTTWSDFVKVDIAENGLVAVEKFREYRYDLILMDLQMPVMNGFDATERIREHDTKIPIIALTANSSSQEADKARTLGMNEYMSKPFKPQDLYAKIIAALP
jgi:signal transduction histidine kinase/response regulator of citrate/malate metabolism